MAENTNTDPFQEVIQIKKAKRRLLGSFIILIFLVLFSLFFLQDRSIEKNTTDIKINFMKKDYDLNTNEVSDLDKNTPIEIEEKIQANESEPKTNVNSLKDQPTGFYIQFGVFENKKSAEDMVNKLSVQNIKSLIEDMSQEKKFKVRSEYFTNKEDAKSLFDLAKKNNIDGIIKQANK